MIASIRSSTGIASRCRPKASTRVSGGNTKAATGEIAAEDATEEHFAPSAGQHILTAGKKSITLWLEKYSPRVYPLPISCRLRFPVQRRSLGLKEKLMRTR